MQFKKFILILAVFIILINSVSADLIAHYSFDYDDKERGIINDVSGNGNNGIFPGNTRLLIDFDDGTANDESGYDNHGTLISSEKMFSIRDSNGNAIASFGTLTGNLFLKGEINTNPCTATDEDEFRFQDLSGNDVMIIDMNGNMCIKGSYSENEGTLTPTPNSFIVQDESGNVVSYIDQSGNLYLKGELKRNANNGQLEGIVDCNVDGISGKACSFDGADDYVNTGTDSSLDFTNLGYTVELWYYKNSDDNSYTGLITKSQDDGANIGGWNLWLDDRGTTNNLKAEFRGSDSNWHTATSIIDYNVWTYIAAVVSPTEIKVYKNGVFDVESSPYSGITMVRANTHPLLIGKYDQDVGFFNGTIDEVAIYSKTLTPEEIQKHYNAKKADFTDWTTDTVAGYGYALEFDGVDDYVDTMWSGNLDIWTIETWVKDDGTQTNYRAIVQTYIGGDDAFYIYPVSSNSVLAYWPAHGGTTSIPSNVWKHVAATKDNSNIIRYYVNGEPAGASSPFTRPINKIQIGGNSYDDPELFAGVIDEVKIYDKALTAEQIKGEYDIGINPPTLSKKRAAGFKPNMVTISFIVAILSLLSLYDIIIKRGE